MKTYYVVFKREKKYAEVRAFRLSDVRLWMELKGLTSKVIEDDYQDVRGFRQSSLTELPFDFRTTIYAKTKAEESGFKCLP